jgi:hypothetical protein
VSRLGELIGGVGEWTVSGKQWNIAFSGTWTILASPTPRIIGVRAHLT